METLKPTLEELEFCVKDPQCIRNVCILAHVDHGKTTVADSLLATNRLVSKRLAGSLRYLDDRPDEQERGITMKSSAVSLLNVIHDDNENRRILMNLIDTPGHIDFSTEVGAALRVCDGAIILVDLVEGVCVQTRESIKNAFEERAKMLLVLNKFDRLVVELNKDVEEIFQCILRVIEDCNACIAELYQYEFNDNEVDIEDTGLLFSPDSGNVIFASAVDGWGITTHQIAKMFVNLVKNETVESLNKKFWDFDCYVDAKKEIKTGAIDKKKTNLFVQFFLKTLVHIYQTIVIRMERDKTKMILEKLNIKDVTRDMTHNDPKIQVRAILQAWTPLATTILLQSLKIFPSPSKMDIKKIQYLLNANRFCEDPYLNKCVENMIPVFQETSRESRQTFAYVSKMFCVNKKNLSQNKPKVFIPKPRDQNNIAQRMEKLEINREKEKPEEHEEHIQKIEEEFSVIALARVFTGELRIGQEIYVMSSAYVPDETKISEDPDKFVTENKYVQKVIIEKLYMLFGRELTLVDSIPAGNVCGIGGLQASVLRTATLSTNLEIVPFYEKTPLDPVVRHAIEPVNPKDLPVLRNGLKLLMQSDSCVQVVIQETGELVLLTAGDVHLGKCIEDLTTKFAKIEVHVSSPMVSLRETIINKPVDTVEEVLVETSDFILSCLVIRLPENIVNVIKTNYELLKTVEDHHHKSIIDIIKNIKESPEQPSKAIEEKTFKSDLTKRAVAHIKEQLKNEFESSGKLWNGVHDRIWSVGNMSDCTNILINDTDDYCKNIFTEINVYDRRTFFDHCIVKAFNNFCKAGPLCEEPLSNCAFFIKKFQLVNDVVPEDITPQTTSMVESMVRSTLKRAFEKQEMRLMEPTYTTDIQVNTNILGKVYTVVNRRHGKVLDAVGMDESEKTFLVKAQIPVVESIGFASEIRKTTSGQANPNLRFSHYEIIDGDPFYEAVEEDGDDDEENINVDSGLRANKLRKDVRRRKGLQVEDEVVIHAEKQRTLNKKK